MSNPIFKLKCNKYIGFTIILQDNNANPSKLNFSLRNISSELVTIYLVKDGKVRYMIADSYLNLLESKEIINIKSESEQICIKVIQSINSEVKLECNFIK